MQIIRFFGALTMLWLSTSLAHAQQINARYILSDYGHYAFSISPDNRHFVYMTLNAGQNEIHIADLKTKEIISTYPLRKYIPKKIVWVSNDRLLMSGGGVYSLTTGQDPVQPVFHGDGRDNERVYAKSEFRKYMKRWQLRHALPNDAEHVLIESFDSYDISRLYKLNLFSGELTDLISGKAQQIKRWYLTPEGLPRIAHRISGDRNVFYLVDPETMALVEHDDRFPAGPVKFNFSGGERYQRSHAPHTVLSNPDKFLITRLKADGRYELVSYDPVNGQLDDILMTDSRYDVGTDVSRTFVQWDSDQTVVGVGYQHIGYSQTYNNDDLSSLYASINRQLPDTQNVIWDLSDDFQSGIVQSKSPATRPDWYIYDAKSDELALIERGTLADRNSLQPSAAYGQIPMADGTLIDTMILSPHPEMPTRGLVIAPMMTVGIRDHFDWDANSFYLASRGFTVVRFNSRGTIGYGRDAFFDGIANGLDLMFSDIVEITRWAVEQELDDNRGVFLFGEQHNGTIAYNVATRYPDLFDAMVTYHAPVDIPRFNKWLKKRNVDVQVNYWTMITGAAGNNGKILDALSLKSQLDRLQTPWQVFHHETNQITDGKAMQKLLDRRKSKKTPIVYRNIGAQQTIDQSRDMHKLFLDMTIKFFDRHGDSAGVIELN